MSLGGYLLTAVVVMNTIVSLWNSMISNEIINLFVYIFLNIITNNVYKTDANQSVDESLGFGLVDVSVTTITCFINLIKCNS